MRYCLRKNAVFYGIEENGTYVSGLWCFYNQLDFKSQSFLSVCGKRKNTVLLKDDVFYVGYVNTRQDCRGRGMADKLLKSVLSMEADKNYRCALITTGEKNYGMRKVCERNNADLLYLCRILDFYGLVEICYRGGVKLTDIDIFDVIATSELIRKKSAGFS